MTPPEWNVLLAPTVSWQQCYAIVAKEARAYLEIEAPSGLGTAGLVEGLYPIALARGAGYKARARLFKALAALADHDLKDCCTRGEGRPGKGRMNKTMVRPIYWHAPKAMEACQICPHCGEQI